LQPTNIPNASSTANIPKKSFFIEKLSFAVLAHRGRIMPFLLCKNGLAVLGKTQNYKTRTLNKRLRLFASKRTATKNN
jgi:hypothetical protein